MEDKIMFDYRYEDTGLLMEDFIEAREMYPWLTEEEPYITSKDIARIIEEKMPISMDVFDCMYGNTNDYEIVDDIVIEEYRHGWLGKLKVIKINDKLYGIPYDYHDDYGVSDGFVGEPAVEVEAIPTVTYRIKEE